MVHSLAQQAGVSEATVRRAEAVDGTPRMRSDNLLALQGAMETAGVVFLDAGDSDPAGWVCGYVSRKCACGAVASLKTPVSAQAQPRGGSILHCGA